MSANVNTGEFPSPNAIGQGVKNQFKEWAAETFAHGGYPASEMGVLANAGLLSCMLPGEPLDLTAPGRGKLLELLRTIGEGNLSVGRIYEGHVNAIQLIALYGTEAQRQRYFTDARRGHVFGVWNTEMADGVRFHPAPTGLRVSGSKSFCSGSIHVTRPIITGQLAPGGNTAGGWQMAVVPLDKHQPPVDRTFWTTTGMKNSVSHKIDFTDIHLAADDLLGQPNDYNRQPHLSGGAVRFAAVQLGGAEAILHATRTYLRQMERTADPHQRMRLGQMVIGVESGKLWLRRAGEMLDSQPDADAIVNMANQVRTAITGYCKECLELSDQSVGARGMLPPQPLARLHADLRVYLRQPAPDATLGAVGQYFLDGAS
ncbi:alkylation response protein AidB-like acyl-CoA dehydrogenase [Neolewinella xylanilytica]|uniref:Alkylation response protein AidB-like acyl-CoA dehydrogenase n=1 Tax=Neolewinella xylanilytica TaxID=1514080 RepID=A0A2S6IA01_9BACT|nr:acyl-CoA dehydrogenase family protein [Neolewinella xylanilytica]PPK88321.1 alkylation response protein AidB-like acyl-CoA dehydrogenase [Neolewinella xylanilytica]